MGFRVGRIVAVSAGVAMSVAGFASGPASAAPANAVPWSQAQFSGYGSGAEVHVGAVSENGTSVADLDQGFSTAATNTAGFSTNLIGDNGGLAGQGIQLIAKPSSPAVKAVGLGAGLKVGLVAPANGSGDQIDLAGVAQQVAPPNNPAQTSSIPSASCPDVNGVPECLALPADLATAGVLTGRGAAIFDATQCPLGQPISYGLGDAADAHLIGYSGLTAVTSALSSALKALGITVPTTGYVVTNQGDARTTSLTFLSNNGDGSFGLTTESFETIAPVSIDLLGAAQLQLEVGGAINADGSANPAVPISLTSKVTGEASGAEVSLGADDVISLTLVANGTKYVILPATSLAALVGQGGLILTLDPQTLVSQLATAVSSNPVLNSLGSAGSTLGTLVNQISSTLQPVTSALPNVSLGEIAIGTPPRAINSDPAAKVPTTPTPLGTPSATDGTHASAAFDLARVAIAPTVNNTTTVLANVFVGHLESAATLAAPILCHLPVIKTANPTAVKAGDSFTYNIQVPDPAKLALLDCSLVNMTVTDDITDYQGSPTFTVTSAKVVQTGTAGAIQTLSSSHAVVTWTGLNYTVAATGQPPNPPIQLQITVTVPPNSPAGVIQDTVSATATATGCHGGVSGIENLGVGASGAVLAGSYTLEQPNVAAVLPAALKGNSLPFTGAMGGLWQPVAGLGVLAGGAGLLALTRRARRRLP